MVAPLVACTSTAHHCLGTSVAAWTYPSPPLFRYATTMVVSCAAYTLARKRIQTHSRVWADMAPLFIRSVTAIVDSSVSFFNAPTAQECIRTRCKSWAPRSLFTATTSGVSTVSLHIARTPTESADTLHRILTAAWICANMQYISPPMELGETAFVSHALPISISAAVIPP